MQNLRQDDDSYNFIFSPLNRGNDDIMYFNKKLEKEDLVNLEALGFWLMHKIGDEKDFCKQSHFWPGYIQ